MTLNYRHCSRFNNFPGKPAGDGTFDVEVTHMVLVRRIDPTGDSWLADHYPVVAERLEEVDPEGEYPCAAWLVRLYTRRPAWFVELPPDLGNVLGACEWPFSGMTLVESLELLEKLDANPV
jgi:hypothetical protein